MKVLLTHGYFLSEDKDEARVMKPYPPAGLLYLSAWLDKEKIENEIFDSTFATYPEITDYLSKTAPQIIGIYCTLRTKLNVLKIIEFLRQNQDTISSKIILGGPDARQNAENYLLSGADVIIPGEGEQTFAEVVSLFSGSPEVEMEQIKGIIFRNKTGEIINSGEQRLMDMDSLPVPARNRINIHQYLGLWKLRHGYSSMTVSSMRGCPYSCKWCSKSVFGNTYRRRSPGLVVDELELLKETYHPDRFWFTDDVFTLGKNWLKTFSDEIAKRNISISYECISRTDCMDDEILILLKKSGCKKIWLGAESGSQKILNLMDRKTDIRRTIQVLKLVRKQGLSSGTFIMLGYPGEKKKDIYQTLAFLKEIEPDEFTLTTAYPIKGTKLYSELEPVFLKPFDWKTSTERDIEFERPYSKPFYRFAIRFISNYMASVKAQSGIKKWKFRLKSVVAKWMMEII